MKLCIVSQQILGVAAEVRILHRSSPNCYSVSPSFQNPPCSIDLFNTATSY